jgi:F420-dependent oxidoreductase-like protein
MKMGISVGSAYYDGSDWSDIVNYILEAEKLGVNEVWSAEAWGMDALVPLAYIAAKTEKIKLGTGILQISSRVPSMIAMSAQSMATVSNNRFMLGLGVSGPQVVEGLHGASFASPLGRLRECLQLVRMGLNGERMQFEGKHYRLPRPGGEGKAIRLSQAPQPQMPIYLATLGPKAMHMTGELADGWLGTAFMPEHADIFLDPLKKGAEAAGRNWRDIEIQVMGDIEIGDDVERMIEARKPDMAFVLGGMGSANTNFYNSAYSRAGYHDAAQEVQRLWVEGKKTEAIQRVPDEMVLKSHLIGTETMVKERLRVYRAAGVTGLRLVTRGETMQERVDHIARSMDVARAELATESEPC